MVEKRLCQLKNIEDILLGLQCIFGNLSKISRCYIKRYN